MTKPSKTSPGCMVALVLLQLALCISTTKAQTPEYRAFWLDAFHSGFLNQGEVDNLLGVPGTTEGGQIRAANCNMVIVQVRKRADVCYPSGVGEPYMSSLSPANFNALAALIKAAHDTTGGKKRVEVHCWSVAFKTAKGVVYSQHRDSPTGSLTDLDNYWPTRVDSTTGSENSDGAFDPGHPKALEYLVNAHMDLVNFQTTAGPDGTDGHIDGIHYDYIRFEGGTEGYNPTSVARYNARYGLTGDPDSNDPQFRQWRRDQVSAFVRQMYARIQKANPAVKQSGAFVTWNPSPTDSTRGAFQATRPYGDRSDGVYSDWDSWIQEGIMDIAIPMTYYNWASLPNDFTRWMNFEKDRKGNRHMIVGPGVYLNNLDNAILELQMIRQASPSGNSAHGFACYSYAVPYASGSWAGFAPRFVSEITPTWADIPDMPWKTSPTKGHIMGTVTLPGTGAWADRTMVNITGPVSRSMEVDGTGFYAFIDLPPGTYTIQASKIGYASVTTSANVGVGEVQGNMYERNLVLSPLNAAPEISSHPANQTVVIGQDASFNVSVIGTAPLSYQWRFNLDPIPGATSDSYTRVGAQTAHAGSYDVVITNVYGAETSNPAILVVNPPPIDFVIDNLDPEASFEGMWQSGSGGEQWGSGYRFALTLAGGQSNAIYRPYIGIAGKYNVSVWYRMGSNRPTNANWRVVYDGGDQSTAVDQTINGGTWVRIGAALPFASGTNGCVILSNDCSQQGKAAIADAVRFTLVPPPVVTTPPQSLTNMVGTDASFLVSASGEPPLAYQWHFNGMAIPGATDPGYTRNAVINTHQGDYYVVITNAVGAVTSSVASLTVVYPSPPSFLSPGVQLVENTLTLQFTGGPGVFTIEASPDLLTWTNRAIVETSVSTAVFEESISDASCLFYRIKREP